MKIRGGVDPGKTGAIVIIKDGSLIREVISFTIPLIGKEVDLAELVKIFEEIAMMGSDIHFVLEDVHAIFGASAGSTFTFGRVVGQVEAILATFMIPYSQVAPKKWQAEMFEGVNEQRKPTKTFQRLNKKTGQLEEHTKKGSIETKKMALIAAQKLFPKANLIAKGARTPHDGIVDALLMAEYCRRKF